MKILCGLYSFSHCAHEYAHKCTRHVCLQITMDFDKWAFPFVAAARKHLELFGSSFGGMEQTVCDEAVVGEAAVAGK